MRGTMTQRSPGTWRLRVVTGYDAEGRPQQLSRTVQGTKRQAQSALAKFVAEVGQAPHATFWQPDVWAVPRRAVVATCRRGA